MTASGRGERLAPLLGLDGEPYRCPFWIVVAVREAFEQVELGQVDRVNVRAARSDDHRVRGSAFDDSNGLTECEDTVDVRADIGLCASQRFRRISSQYLLIHFAVKPLSGSVTLRRVFSGQRNTGVA